MTLDAEIREELRRYWGEGITLAEFREWLAPRAWNIQKRADENVVRFVNQIEAIFSEFDHGDWTEEEVRQQLVKLTEIVNTGTWVSPIPGMRASITTGSTINTRHFGRVQLFQSPRIYGAEPAKQDMLQPTAR